jgi:hypothetical protein
LAPCSLPTLPHACYRTGIIGDWVSDDKKLAELSDLFENARPFPYVVIDNFFSPAAADRIEGRFPVPNGTCSDWQQQVASNLMPHAFPADSCRLYACERTCVCICACDCLCRCCQSAYPGPGCLRFCHLTFDALLAPLSASFCPRMRNRGLVPAGLRLLLV